MKTLIFILYFSFPISLFAQNNPISNSREYHEEKGDSLFAKKEFVNAVNAYTSAIKKESKLSELYMKRAKASFAAKDYDSAIKDFSEFIKYDASNAQEAYFLRGLIKLTNNDKFDGCEDIKKAKEMGFEAEYEGFMMICGTL